MTCSPSWNARTDGRAEQLRSDRRSQPRLVTPPGNAAGRWRAALDAAPVLTLTEVGDRGRATRSRRLVVLSAHPDDETIGAGRVVADWARRYGSAEAITLTAGEACVDHVGVTIPGLASRRIAEWQSAVRVLGAEPHPCWHIPDGRVGDVVGELGDRLARLVGEQDLLLAPWRHDPHPDHVAAGRVAAYAAARSGAGVIEYPVWMTYWCGPAQVEHTAYELLQMRTDPLTERCRQVALGYYASQQRPLRRDLAPVVPAAMLAHHDRQLILRPRRRTDD